MGLESIELSEFVLSYLEDHTYLHSHSIAKQYIEKHFNISRNKSEDHELLHSFSCRTSQLLRKLYKSGKLKKYSNNGLYKKL